MVQDSQEAGGEEKIFFFLENSESRHNFRKRLRMKEFSHPLWNMCQIFMSRFFFYFFR